MKIKTGRAARKAGSIAEPKPPFPKQQQTAPGLESKLKPRPRFEAEAQCLLLCGDLSDPTFCADAVEATVRDLGGLDILVSNAAQQQRKESLDELTDAELERTFNTNVYAYFRLARAALKHMKPGAAIIATSSVTGLKGSEELPDYSATRARSMRLPRRSSRR